MTERERRQRRLLAVRTLEADLAATQLRLLRNEQDALRRKMQICREQMHSRPPASGSGHTEWLLGYAEQELAALRAKSLLQQIGALAETIEIHAADERLRRQTREQMQRLCDRTAHDACIAEERTTQARLDDLFSAMRLRRLAK